MTAIVKRLGNPCRISPELNFSRFTDEDSRPVSWQKMDAGLAPKSSDLSARGGPTRSFLVRYGIYPALKGLYPEPARPRRASSLSWVPINSGRELPWDTRDPAWSRSTTLRRAFTRQHILLFFYISHSQQHRVVKRTWAWGFPDWDACQESPTCCRWALTAILCIAPPWAQEEAEAGEV